MKLSNKFNRLILFVIIFMVLLSAILGFIFSIYLFSIPYSESSSMILNITHNQHLIKVFEETPYRVHKLKILILSTCIMCALTFALALYLFIKREKLLQNILNILYKTIDLINKQYKYYYHWPLFYRNTIFLVFILYICFKIILLFELPPFLDETGTFKYFSSKGIITAASYYPIPNNHILNSVLTAITIHLPFDILIGLRIPAFIFSILLFFVALKFLSTLLVKDFISIILFLIIICFLPPVTSYGCLARGYIYLLVFYIIQLNALVFIFNGKYIKNAFILYVFAGTLGIYTVPTHLYPVIVNFFLFGLALLYLRRFKDLIHFLSSNILMAILTLVLYSPIILVSGINSIINNPFTKPKGFGYVAENIVDFWNGWFSWSFGTQNQEFLLYFIIILLLIQLVFFKTKIKLFALFLIINLLIHSLLFLIQGTIPFQRNLIYLIIPLVLSLGWFLIFMVNENKNVFVIVCILVTSVLISAGFNFHHTEFKKDYNSENLISRLKKENWELNKLDTIYSENLYYYESMIDFERSRLGAKRELIILPLSAKTESCKYIIFKKTGKGTKIESCKYYDEEYCITFCNR